VEIEANREEGLLPWIPRNSEESLLPAVEQAMAEDAVVN